jgi:hypothetical protein
MTGEEIDKHSPGHEAGEGGLMTERSERYS